VKAHNNASAVRPLGGDTNPARCPVVFTLRETVKLLTAGLTNAIGGSKVQVVRGGRLPQLKFTFPLKPLSDVAVIRKLTVCPAEMVAALVPDVIE
jgi:hypothetical protein